MNDKQYQEKVLEIFKEGIDETIQILNGYPNFIDESIECSLNSLENQLKSSQKHYK